MSGPAISFSIAQNVAQVRERMAWAARRAGRRPEAIRLMAVSKTVPPERIREAYAAGVVEFGENRVQEAEARRPALADLRIRWHLVGHLQSNKAKRALELFDVVESVDSLSLAARLDRLAAELRSEPLPVLVEVHMGGEETKSGVDEPELLPLVRELAPLGHLAVRGLMAVPPFLEDPEQVRPYFRHLRELAGQVAAAGIPGIAMEELSMGMSHDFEVAIEEGATIVRIGTAIFGERAKA